MIQTVFNRYEKKYLMTEPVYHELRRRLDEHMEQDKYGLHTICNIYFDTPDDLLIRRSLERPVYKEKLRLRSYGVPKLDSTVFLEIKKKYRKIVNKRREPMTLEEAMRYTELGERPRRDSIILDELDFLMARYAPVPRLFLAYDRIALFGKDDPNFRITFDQNIRSRRHDVALEKGSAGELLLPNGYYLMESKISGAAPLWFARLLSELSVYPTSFSKYGNIYKKEHGRWSLASLPDPARAREADEQVEQNRRMIV